jgi:hypothetical protein
MPTLGTRDRGPLLRRALRSVRSQVGVRPIPLIVFNGPAVDATLMEELAREPDTRTLVLAEADLPAALLEGRRLVREPWFTALDDDDEFLPRALELRLAVLESRPEYGAVVTNGLRRNGPVDTLHLPDISLVAADPLGSLGSENWLLPGSWLCRTRAVAESALAGMPPHLECTYLAVRLTTVTRVAFLQDPTVVYYEDTPSSASKTPGYILGQESSLRRILQLELPPGVRRTFELRLAPASWQAASVLAKAGDRGGAWRQRVRALSYPGGWRLLPAVRRLPWPDTAR